MLFFVSDTKGPFILKASDPRPQKKKNNMFTKVVC